MKKGQRIGPYVVEEPLSAGAMGALHLARHVETGAVVALKTVHHALRAHLHGLRREIRALQAVDHPNVVRILDADVDAGPPWYAMELIEGLSLDKHWSVAPTQTRWSTYLRCFADICDGLEAVHGLGMIHRDLKPGNVVLRSTEGAGAAGEAVVVDFGLATVSGGGLGREQLYKRSEVVGTPQYISPEQVSQQHLDPRADLYSLGCMLFELIVGRPPFTSEVPFVGMLKHVNETPVVPDDVVARVPPPLVELVYALLEKSPANRPGYADDVRQVLAALGDVPDRSTKPAARTYLHRPAFGGRDDLAPRFEEVGERLAAGRGGVVAVRGPAGAGKSRVAIELIRRVQVHADEHVEILLALSPQSTTTPPLGSLRAAFEEIVDICLERGDRFAAEVLGDEAALLSTHLPVLRSVPGVGEPTSAQLNPETVEGATLDAITAILERVARQRPLVLALDDLQWADPLTDRWLHRAATDRPWTRVPFLLVLVGRDDAAAFDAYASDCEAFEVGPLAPDALARMVESMTGVDEVPPEFFAALQAEARGLPSRAAQWLSAAVGRGALVRTNGQWRFEGVPIDDANIRHTVALNATFDMLLAQRLRTLGAGHGALVDLIAVLGPIVRPEVLAYLGASEVELLDDLITEGLLVQSARGDVAFASPELNEIALSRLEGRNITPLHVRSAAILEALGSPVLEVTHHLALSGWRDEARARLFAAADAAFDRGVWAEAEQLYAAASDLGFRQPDHAVIGHARLAVLRFRHGRSEAAAAALREAESALSSTDDVLARGELARARGLLMRASDPVEAKRALEEACEAFAAADAWADERNARIELGNTHCRLGDFAAGRAVFTQVHDWARTRGDAEGVAVALASVGTTWISDRRYEAAEDFLRRAAEQFRSLGLPARLGDALYNLGVCRVDQGLAASAIDVFEETCAIRAAAGDQRGVAQARSALGHALLAADRPADALTELDAAIAVLERMTDSYLLAAAHGYAGEAAAQERQFSRAMDHFVEALTIHRSLPFSTLQPYVHVEIAKLHRRLGLYEDARVQLEKSRALFAEDDALIEVAWDVEHAYLELACGRAPAVDLPKMRAALASMQLPDGSPVSRAIETLELTLAADQSLQHGELVEKLPAAYR